MTDNSNWIVNHNYRNYYMAIIRLDQSINQSINHQLILRQSTAVHMAHGILVVAYCKWEVGVGLWTFVNISGRCDRDLECETIIHTSCCNRKARSLQSRLELGSEIAAHPWLSEDSFADLYGIARNSGSKKYRYVGSANYSRRGLTGIVSVLAANASHSEKETCDCTFFL